MVVEAGKEKEVKFEAEPANGAEEKEGVVPDQENNNNVEVAGNGKEEVDEGIKNERDIEKDDCEFECGDISAIAAEPIAERVDNTDHGVRHDHDTDDINLLKSILSNRSDQ